MAKKVTNMEEALASQIPEFNDVPPTTNYQTKSIEEQEHVVEEHGKTGMLGAQLNHKPGTSILEDKDGDREMVHTKHLSRIGESIDRNSFIRDGWMLMDKSLLGGRAMFYPEDWNFYIRPATVEAIRNWSTIDDNNMNVIDDVFNEILKSCLTIRTSQGQKPWYCINSWDRFFFVLTIREYTFEQGESKIEYHEECTNCECDVVFDLTSQSLMYDMPDQEVMSMYDQQSQTWLIDPMDYDIDTDPITLYLPTVEKDANIKAWMIARLQENRNAKIDSVFIKFLTWLAPKISKDENIAKRQVKEYKAKFESWDIEMFQFMDDVIANIIVTPATSLKTTCPSCGEEVTSVIRFPDGVSSLFNVVRKSKKFGSKSAIHR